MSDNLAPATPRDDTENMSLLQLGKARGCAPNAAIWGRGGRGIGGIAIEGALCLRRRRPESLRSCHICAIPSLDTNVACLLQHPGSRCRSSEGPLTSSDRQSVPFLPSVQTAGYHGTENLAGKTNRPCCTGHDDAACLMPVLRHSFAAQPTALQRLRSGSQVTSGTRSSMRARDGILNRRRREAPPRSVRFRIDAAIMPTVVHPHRPSMDFFNVHHGAV